MQDLVEALEDDIQRTDEKRNRAAALHNTGEHTRLVGEIEGLKRALGYVASGHVLSQTDEKPAEQSEVVRTLHVKGSDYWGDGDDNTLAVNFDLLSDHTVRWERTNLGGWT